jgi:hypothetical protein
MGAPRRDGSTAHPPLFFGASGDVEYLDECISANGLLSVTVAERTITVRGELTSYFVRRLTIG